MVNSKVSSQPPIASYWPGHSRKKSKHGGLRIWNFKGYWKNRIWKFQGSTKKKKGISRDDQENIMRNFHGSWFMVFGIFKWCNTILWNFQGWSFVLSGSSKAKATNLQISEVFSKKYVLNPLLFGFFLE